VLDDMDWIPAHPPFMQVGIFVPTNTGGASNTVVGMNADLQRQTLN
jgi:hypothetical protein